MESIFYFLQTLLVTAQQRNLSPFLLNHRLYMHMYNVAQHKYDLCKLKSWKEVVAYLVAK